jgi:hypothetical protein
LGFPIVEVSSSGELVLTKPPGTGGLIDRNAVAEQMLYEVGDPANYILPDVICDFTGVKGRNSPIFLQFIYLFSKLLLNCF